MLERFADIIDAWPEPSAVNLGADLGIPAGTVRVWRHRDVIPSRHWARLVAQAEARGVKGVTYELIARLAAARDGGSAVPPLLEEVPANA